MQEDGKGLDRRSLLAAGGVAALASPALAAEGGETISVSIDTRQVTGALPHIWSECAGSDRAAITLRESWRKDLVRGHQELGIKRIRFHGIFCDEMGVLAPTLLNRGKVEANYRNIFDVYDGLVERGVAPYVELSFMPQALASAKTMFGFYNGNTSPPKTNEAWADFISGFVKALINRYGLAAVRTWPFEVWNEPDLRFFWTGTQQQYFDMYKATALAIKAIDAQIQVGGPATSSAQWVGDFAAWTAANNAPVDFFATHCYASDRQTRVFGADRGLSQYDVIPAAMKKARDEIDATIHKGKPLFLSEWSSDSPAFIAHVIQNCLPNVQGMSHWVLSGSYEELGVPNYELKEGDMGFYLTTKGVNRSSYNAYRLLHQLGDKRLAADGPVLASRRTDGSVSALVWNLADVVQPSGIPGQTTERVVKGAAKTIAVRFAGARPGAAVKVSFVDQERGSPMPAWRKMGSPQYPSPAQMAVLRKASEVAPPVRMRLDGKGVLSLTLPPEGVALIELA